MISRDFNMNFSRNAVRIFTASPRKIVTYWLRFQSPFVCVCVCIIFLSLSLLFTSLRVHKLVCHCFPNHHTHTRGFDFGNFIFWVGRRMRELQPKGNREQRKENAVLYFFFPLVCMCNFGKRCQCEKREPYRISVDHLQTRHAHASYTRTHARTKQQHDSISR